MSAYSASLGLQMAEKKRKLMQQRRQFLQDKPEFAKHLKIDETDGNTNNTLKCDDVYATQYKQYQELGMDEKSLDKMSAVFKRVSSYVQSNKKQKSKGVNGVDGADINKVSVSDVVPNSNNEDHVMTNHQDITYSSSSEESSDEIEEDQSVFKLDEEEIGHYKSSFKKSDLIMKLQGFKSLAKAGSSTSENDNDESKSLQQNKDTSTDDIIDWVEYNGKRYDRGKVYKYTLQDGQCMETLVGIHSLIGKDRAKCVLVANFKDTALWRLAEDANHKDCIKFKLSDFPSYVQVFSEPFDSSFQTLHISRLGDLFEEYPSMPKMVYEAQTDSDYWESFAYYLHDGNMPGSIKRCGRRDSVPTIKEYFAGAGGSHEAYKQTFETYLLIEKDDIAIQSLKENNPKDHDKIFHGCITKALDEQKHCNTSPDASHFSSP